MNKPNKMAIAAMIISFLSIILCCYPPYQLVLGIAAITAAILSRTDSHISAPAIIGIAIGVVSIICSFFMLSVLLDFIDNPSFADVRQEVYHQLQSMGLLQ